MNDLLKNEIYKAIEDKDCDKLKSACDTIDNLAVLINALSFEEVVEFNSSALLKHIFSFPQAKRTLEIKLIDGISHTIRNNYIESLTYLADSFPEHYHVAVKSIASVDFSNVIKNDSLEAIQFIYDSKLGGCIKVLECLKKSIVFDAKKCFNYFLEKVQEKDIEENYKINLLYLCTNCNRENFLDVLVEKKMIDIDKHMSAYIISNTLANEETSCLYYIVDKYDFTISEENLKNVKNLLYEPLLSNDHKSSIEYFIKYAESHDLEKKLSVSLNNKDKKNKYNKI